jgi:hypothetical protein
MTKEEFLESFSLRSGFSKSDFDLLGMEAVKCNCKLDRCPGWTMESKLKNERGENGNTDNH